MDENLLEGKTLLVVDDEADLRDIVASELEFMGATVFQAGNVTAAKELLLEKKIDLVISDIRMPGGTGIDLLDFVKAANTRLPPVLLITGFADITVEEAFDKGSEALINKPFKLDDLIATVSRFTQPLNERFDNDEIKATRKIELTFKNLLASTPDCSIGRGGISLRLDLADKRIDLSEALELSLKFDDAEIHGTALPRWLKHPDQSSNKLEIGLEFLKLTPETLNRLMNFWQGHDLTAYIPSL